MSDELSLEDLLGIELRWPREGDRLFTRAEAWDANANISQDKFSRLVYMKRGYKKAADLLVKQAQTGEHRDLLVYPIVFNYRQYLELQLKYMIYSYGYTVGIEPVWDSHDLKDLWKKFMAVLDGYGVTDGRETDEIVGKNIAEFAQVDPGSFTYRYPVSRGGEFISIAQDKVDLAALADVMEAIEGYFSGNDGMLDEWQHNTPNEVGP